MTEDSHRALELPPLPLHPDETAVLVMTLQECCARMITGETALGIIRRLIERAIERRMPSRVAH